MKKDRNNIEIDTSSVKYQRIKTILDAIQKLCIESKDNVANKIELFNEIKTKGIDLKEAEEEMNHLIHSGHIYEPWIGKYRISESLLNP